MNTPEVTALFCKILSQIPAEQPAANSGMPEQYPIAYFEFAMVEDGTKPEGIWDGLYIATGSLLWEIGATKVYAYDDSKSAGSKWVLQVTFSS